MSTQVVDREKVVPYILATSGAGHVLLFGPPGTGKTSLAMNCAMPGQQITEITLHESANDYGLWHTEVPKSDGKGGVDIVGRPGPIAVALTRGDLLVINEIINASKDILDRLYMALDHWSIAQDTLPDGTVIRISPNARIIATMNGTPDELPEALRDRFALKIPVNQPSQEMVQALDADVAFIINENYEKVNGLSPTFTYREGATFCRVRHALGNDREAANLVFGDKEKAGSFYESLVLVEKRIIARRSQLARTIGELCYHACAQERNRAHLVTIAELLKASAKEFVARQFA